jgi:hypothetical protein
MAKVSEVEQVEFVKDCMRKGLSRKIILSKFGKKWLNLSSKTVDRRICEATKQMQVEIKQIEQGTAESIAKEIESRKSKILTVIERMEILSSIGRGELPLTKPMVCDGVIELVPVVPDWMDRKSAIAELNKMEGDYAPTKTDITSKGEAINTDPFKMIRENSGITDKK